MKLLIIGSTGGTGRELVKQGLEQGHQVKAFARTPSKVGMSHQNLRIAQGDVTAYASIEAAVQGQDAVLCALGTRVIRKNTIQSEGTRNIILAMRKNGIKRLVVETSLDLGDSRGQLGFFFAHVIRATFLRNIFEDKELQERLVRDSQLDWVIVRPAMLTNGPRTGRYRAGFSAAEKVSRKISRADVADFMLKQATSNDFLQQTPGLSY